MLVSYGKTSHVDFHAGVALSWFKSQANPYKSVIISDQTSEYLYFINLGLVRETNPWLRNTTNVSLTFLFTYCRTCSHMCRLKFSQWAIWISFTSDCFRIRFQLAISLNSSDLKKALGRGDHNFNKLPCLICATHHRSHTKKTQQTFNQFKSIFLSASQVSSECLTMQTAYPLACIHTSSFPRP